MNRIEVSHVSKEFRIRDKNTGRFGGARRTTLHALRDISFAVESGQMMGVIGVNGSGKTTLLRLVSGIYGPTSGTIRIEGQMAPMLQIGTGFHEELNARENIILYGMYLGMTRDKIGGKIGDIISFAELGDFEGMRLKHYSAGMWARLAFSTALQIDPDILVVDEILSVGDAAFRKKSFEEFLKFKNAGRTILYTSHDLENMRELCDSILLLNGGRCEYIGEPARAIEMYVDIISQRTGQA